MRVEDVARGVAEAFGTLERDVDDAAALESPDVLDVPLVVAGLGDAPIGTATPLEVSADEPLVLGRELLGAMLFGEVLGVVVELGDVLLEESAGVGVMLDAGRLRLTSPLDVPVTVLLGEALLTGTQSAVLVAELAAPSMVDDAVVPLAPFVVLGPLKRCSGFVAELRAESAVAVETPAVAPVVAEAPGLIVVDVE